ncbi:MAG: sensor histidine kinase [Oscillochloris sp.]|nr:sensor histidine kinase [Oscillochloris sp.]
MLKSAIIRVQSLWIAAIRAFKQEDKQILILSDDNLLAIFRIAVFSRLVVAINVYFLAPYSFEWLSLVRLLTILETLVLTIYLLSNPLHRWLKQRFLPIALLWATVIPLFITAYSMYLFLITPIPPDLQSVANIENIENFVVLSNVAQTLPVLLIPLLVISWRGTGQQVAWFCMGTSLLDFALMVVFVPLSRFGFILAFTLIGFRLIILGMVGIIVNQLVRVQRTQAKALHEANVHLRDANAHLRDYATTREHLIASQERNRLAREMHDTLADSLAAVMVQLEAVKVIWDMQPDRAKQLVDESAETVRGGLQETRRALQALRAETLESIGFIESIHELATTTQARYGISVSIDANGDSTWLSSEQEHIIYRIVQESLLNSMTHAQAQHIHILLDVKNDTLKVSVRDDGVGFEPGTSNPQEHFGIQGMRERAAIIGADLDIISQIGQGTTINVDLQRNPDAHSYL